MTKPAAETANHSSLESTSFVGYLRSVGPAIIVASVVLGPGSILTNSKVGWQFGYQAVWVLALAVIFMMVMTNIAMRVGVGLQFSPCEEVRRRVGKPVAVIIGLVLFLVAGSFQFSNNLGIFFAIEPFVELEDASSPWIGSGVTVAVLVLLNIIVVVSLLVTRDLYRLVERAMKFLVGMMLVAFAANLVIARPDPFAVLQGLMPNADMFTNDSSSESSGPSPLLPLLGLVATTFSVAGAFYQCYLVRQRKWTSTDLRTGTVDSILGIATLGVMSLMIMATAAAAFYGNPDVQSLSSAADVAVQLRPLFGSFAVVLFCAGILAGALSSFLVNAMIGGCVLSDGLGYGYDIDEKIPRLGTIACLAFGMIIAVAVKAIGFETGSLIIFAQSLTVIGNPLLAGTLLWLVLRKEVREHIGAPKWLLALAGLAFLAVLVLSGRTVLLLLT